MPMRARSRSTRPRPGRDTGPLSPLCPPGVGAGRWGPPGKRFLGTLCRPGCGFRCLGTVRRFDAAASSALRESHGCVSDRDEAVELCLVEVLESAQLLVALLAV